VAILSRLPLEDVTRGLPGDDSDEQARWIEATVIGPARCGSAGFTCPTATRRRGRNTTTSWPGWPGWRPAAARLLLEEPGVFLGDYNVIPQAEDAAKPEAWVEDALFLPQSRAAFRGC
jgi:exodeoxyribonuclease-3